MYKFAVLDEILNAMPNPIESHYRNLFSYRENLPFKIQTIRKSRT